MDAHESGFIKSFVIPRKQEKYLQLLSNAKVRKKLLDRFNHCQDLDFAHASVIPPELATQHDLISYLQKKGAPQTVHVIADESELDGQKLSLEAALAFATSHDFAVVISCLPGKLAFFKPESPSDIYLFQRT